MSIISKNLIWTEIQTLEIVLELAYRNGLTETHPFMWELLRYKKRIEGDLIEDTEDGERGKTDTGKGQK